MTDDGMALLELVDETAVSSKSPHGSPGTSPPAPRSSTTGCMGRTRLT